MNIDKYLSVGSSLVGQGSKSIVCWFFGICAKGQGVTKILSKEEAR